MVQRRLIAEYFETIGLVASRLSGASLEIATALAALPDEIRGFGPVKLEAMDRAAERRAALLSQLEGVDPTMSANRAA